MSSSISNKELIDANYVDENFINLINELKQENFTSLFTYFVDNHNSITTQTDFSEFIKILNSEFKTEIYFANFYRQIKYLINKGVYYRLSKKFLMELISLGFSEEKVASMRDIQKASLDKLLEINNKAEKDSNNNLIKGVNTIIDVEVKTEMPSYNTNYETFKLDNENIGINEDIKKQNVYINFKLERQHFGENNLIKSNQLNNSINKGFETNSTVKICEIGLFQNLNIKMNKVQLASFYQEIEKIQENLDKLC